MSSGAAFETPGQVAGFVMIGSEASYTSGRCFLNVKKTLTGQNHPITRLYQRNRQAIDPVEAVSCIDNARWKGVGQGCESGHVNSFSMVYRRIAEYFE
ncbi:Hypothetical protein PSEBR_m1047 [Pseudomonas brassicacearum subsp. brassicacearum NFM421]|uniref:Uncharacterized protein n=1 Tax=Pseudomonas brassicacearum (strain NFM421) TaxID=994484 RepID=F2K7R7_PSEBN|nr:Hypothetical protein PSEBR_m1047 [Pseudomonas brassicacearum subsp. brassicacearum NFM421]